MASKCDDDWQSTKKTVLQRSCHMFNNPLMSDISFTCGESKRKYFYAHKYVLATSSVVFYTMFFGHLSENHTVIHLPDTDEESLEEFLRFLYTDDCTLTPDNAIRVMYLAKKYIVPSLIEKCLDVYEQTIQPDNALLVLQQAQLYDEKDLETKCWKVVDQQTNKAVNSEAFVDISQENLVELLKRDTLDIAEVELLQAVSRWSENQCCKKGLELTGENRRAVVGDAVFQIRFLLMSQRQFVQSASRSGLLTPEEINQIFDAFSGFKDPHFKWNCKGRSSVLRKKPKKLHFARFCRPSKWAGWDNGGDADSLSFSVDKNVKFCGVRLFGDDKGSKYQVSFQINDAKVNGTFISNKNEEGIYGFDVMLPTPIAVKANTTVNMTAMITGPKSYWGKGGKSEVKADGVTVSFIEAPSSTNGTSLSEGQFYKIILLAE